MPLSFKEGDVIYLKNVPYTDHSKYQLTLSTEQHLFFVINSEMNNTVAINDEFKHCQVKLSKEPNHSFMDKNESYIACHQLAPHIPCNDIEKMIKSNTAEVKGTIDKETLEKVKMVVLDHSSLTLSPFERKDIMDGLAKVKH